MQGFLARLLIFQLFSESSDVKPQKYAWLLQIQSEIICSGDIFTELTMLLEKGTLGDLSNTIHTAQKSMWNSIGHVFVIVDASTIPDLPQANLDGKGRNRERSTSLRDSSSAILGTEHLLQALHTSPWKASRCCNLAFMDVS